MGRIDLTPLIVTSIIGFLVLYLLAGAAVGMLVVAPIALWAHSAALLPIAAGTGAAAALGLFVWQGRGVF